MYKKRRILALIPARGGSKGLPGKNIRPLLGKPLLAWSIEQALNSQYIDKLVVSTDSSRIASIARKYGAQVPFLRPRSLATDKSSSMDVITHAVNFLKKQGDEFDYIVLIEPTSPLRKKGDIDKAIQRLINNEDDSDSLVSLGEANVQHPAFVKKVVGKWMAPYFAGFKNSTRRQDLDKAYFLCGLIYISKTQKLLKLRTFYQKRTIPYLPERWQYFEIDDIVDFCCVEAILKKKLKGEI